MGIIVCLAMLLGLAVLRPSPWNSQHRVSFHPKFQRCIWILLATLGLWNTAYGLFRIEGFWCFMSVVSGIAMMLAAGIVSASNDDGLAATDRSKFENTVVAILALSFLVYAVTLIQLNLGYAILR